MLFLAVFVVGPIIAGGVADYISSRPSVFAAQVVWDFFTEDF